MYYYELETIDAPEGIDVTEMVTFDEKTQEISIVETTDARLSNQKVIISVKVLVEEKFKAEFSLIINFKGSLGMVNQ